MNSIKRILINHFGARDAMEQEVIQSLWSGYGTISRWQLIGTKVNSVIVKHISLPEVTRHPRGWNTVNSHQRKIKSYEIEMAWYKTFAFKTNANCKVPKCYFSEQRGEEQLIVLEDLDAVGFEARRSQLSIQEAKVGLKWLAHFHGKFMHEKPVDLWQQGTYWHLATRPDEWKAMESGWLKLNAAEIDKRLKSCQYKTIIHGDAKVANFCFNQDLTEVAAVDFQYVGGGCGMKDVAYFLGSCLTEQECETHETEILDFYFSELKKALQLSEKSIDFDLLEQEWRALYSFAWADFSRFLLGWSPSHQKLNGYSLAMVKRTMAAVH